MDNASDPTERRSLSPRQWTRSFQHPGRGAVGGPSRLSRQFSRGRDTLGRVAVRLASNFDSHRRLVRPRSAIQGWVLFQSMPSVPRCSVMTEHRFALGNGHRSGRTCSRLQLRFRRNRELPNQLGRKVNRFTARSVRCSGRFQINVSVPPVPVDSFIVRPVSAGAKALACHPRPTSIATAFPDAMGVSRTIATPWISPGCKRGSGLKTEMLAGRAYASSWPRSTRQREGGAHRSAQEVLLDQGDGRTDGYPASISMEAANLLRCRPASRPAPESLPSPTLPSIRSCKWSKGEPSVSPPPWSFVMA